MTERSQFKVKKLYSQSHGIYLSWHSLSGSRELNPDRLAGNSKHVLLLLKFQQVYHESIKNLLSVLSLAGVTHLEPQTERLIDLFFIERKRHI